MQHRREDLDHPRAPEPGRADRLTTIREAIGGAIGKWLAPAVAAVTRLRESRMFHPVGYTFAGRIEPIIGGHFDLLGPRLDGRVLVRVSSALWKDEREWLDVLGVALRIRRGAGDALTARPEDGDQDLLFATIRSPATMLLAPLATDGTTFLQEYWAVAPFDAPPVGRIELRLVPIGSAKIGGSRIAKFREAVRRGQAGWWLEARKTLSRGWHPIAQIWLEREQPIDQAALAFDPFRTGANLTPAGLVHAIRKAVYAIAHRTRQAAWPGEPGRAAAPEATRR
jgi:hypothetical protein